MRKKVLPLIASILASALLLTALLLLMGGVRTKAAPIVTNATVVRLDAGLELSPGSSQTVEAGTVVAYTHVLTNTDTTTDTDTFTLEARSSKGWLIELRAGDDSTGTALGSVKLPLPLGAGLTSAVVVSITVPTDAWGTVDNTVITATSQNDIGVWKTVTDTTFVRTYVYLPLIAHDYPPLWQQADGTSGIRFYDIAVCPTDPDVQYAGTRSGLYRSTDGGDYWHHWALSGEATPVVVNPNNCAEAFVSVWGDGVYRVTGQYQAALINQGLGEPYLYGLTIAADGQTLYAGTDSLGVYRTNASNIAWVPVNSGISDQRIRSLYLISDTLYAGSRQCTYYSSDDGGSSWSGVTIPGGVLQGGACGDAQVWAIAEMDDVLYAGLGLDKGLYRFAGGTWEQISDVPAATIFNFGLLPAPDGSRLYVGAYGHGVYTCGGTNGGCQPLPNGGLDESNIRGLAIAEISGDDLRLLAGSDDGIWWVPLVP